MKTHASSTNRFLSPKLIGLALPVLLFAGTASFVGCTDLTGVEEAVEETRPPAARLSEAAVGASAAAHGAARVKAECESVTGRFESVVVPPPACPVDAPLICTEGVLDGDIDGTFDFAMTNATEIPPVNFFTGTSDIQTEDDEFLSGIDMGAIDFSNGNFITHITITEGTGELAGATGRIVAIGVLDLEAGVTTGGYVGDLCIPDDDDDDDDDDD